MANTAAINFDIKNDDDLNKFEELINKKEPIEMIGYKFEIMSYIYFWNKDGNKSAQLTLVEEGDLKWT